MKITGLVLLVLINQSVAGGGGGKHHVHFRIHVPDIIKHHIHTKTVFIHVHTGGHGHHGGGGKKKMVPKKKETHHEESHHEDWSSWSSYDDHGGKGHGHEHKHHGTKDGKTSGKGSPHSHGHGAHYTHGGHGQDHQAHPYGNLQAQMLGFDPRQIVNMQMQGIHSDFAGQNPHPVPPHGGGVAGYSYPPQYATHEDLGGYKDVKETTHNNIEPYNEVFEEGYRKGAHSETGHLISEDLKNFYDNKFEEGDAANNGYDSDSFNHYKTHEDSSDHDNEGVDHDGYSNYQDGSDSYLSAVMDTR